MVYVREMLFLLIKVKNEKEWAFLKEDTKYA